MCTTSNRITFSRTFRVQAISELLLPWRANEEPPKVVLSRSCLMIAIQILFHVLPLSAALTLIILNGQGTVTRNFSPGMAGSIQFAAKGFGMLAQSSLASVFLALISRGLLTAKGLPLGALFGPLETGRISYLFSLEYWSLFKAAWLGKRQQATLALATFVILALAVLVGPSGAILMIPRATTHLEFKRVVFFDSLPVLLPRTVTLTSFKQGDLCAHPSFEID